MTDSEIIEAMATKCMGWHRSRYPRYEGYWEDMDGLIRADPHTWNPLANWNDAAMVVEAMTARGFEWEAFKKDGMVNWAFNTTKRVNLFVQAPTTAHAICLAALRALDAEQPAKHVRPRRNQINESKDTLGYY